MTGTSRLRRSIYQTSFLINSERIRLRRSRTLLVLTCVFFSFQDSDRGGFSVRRFAGICNQPSAHMWRFASATVEKWAVPRGVSLN
jgi:hypothetical protein